MSISTQETLLEEAGEVFEEGIFVEVTGVEVAGVKPFDPPAPRCVVAILGAGLDGILDGCSCTKETIREISFLGSGET